MLSHVCMLDKLKLRSGLWVSGGMVGLYHWVFVGASVATWFVKVISGLTVPVTFARPRQDD